MKRPTPAWLRRLVGRAGYGAVVPTFTILDLFAGCGGMTRGFLDDENFELVCGIEFDKAAAATFAANFGQDRTFFGDVADYVDVPHVDVVIGGPPCQGFSNLGKKDPFDHRNKLFLEFLRVVEQSSASVFVLENVDRFLASAEYDELEQETVPGGKLDGFVLYPFLLNAANYGTPQRRVRTVIIGSRVGEVVEPRQTHAKTADLVHAGWSTVEDAIGNLCFSPSEIQLPTRRWKAFEDEDDIPGPFSLAEIHVGRTYRPISIQRYSCIAPGRSRFDLPEDLQFDCWKRHTSGAADVLGRLQWKQPSVTIRTEFFKPEKGRYLHPEWNRDGVQINRALTHAEAALLQGFDDRHAWCGKKVEIARQIGNAVPPPLARAIATRVADVLNGAETQQVA